MGARTMPGERRATRVGIDIGGTKTEAVAVAADGSVGARVRLRTGRGPEAVVRTARDAVAALRGERGVGDIVSVGIGIPGQIESGSTRVRHAVNLDIEDLDLAASLGPALGVPVRIDNDVRAAALGAASLRGGDVSMAYLNLGTGIAAGVITDGMLRRGSRGGAGEIGHLSIDPAGPACRCGQRGCIEALAGGGAVAARWGRGGILPVRDVFDAADGADPVARELRHDIGRGVAAAVRVLILTVDVETVVLGGGIAGLGERLIDAVRGALRESAATSPFLASLRLEERLELLPPGSPAAAIGAALIGSMPEREEEALWQKS